VTPPRIEAQKMYWWTVFDGMRLLIRVEQVFVDYLVIYLLAGTAEEVLRVGHGIGERFSILASVAHLEKAG
jgi:hypothetical protein